MRKNLPGGYTAERCGNPGALRWELRGPQNQFIGNFAAMPQVRAKLRELARARAKLTLTTAEDAARMMAAVS